MRILTTIIVIIFKMNGCTTPVFQKMNFNISEVKSFDLLKDMKDRSFTVRIIDKYEFESNSNKAIVQFLFKIEGNNDTLCLFEYRDKYHEPCPIGEINETFYGTDCQFISLDTIKLNSFNWVLMKKGNIEYSTYSNFTSLEGYFGCHAE